MPLIIFVIVGLSVGLGFLNEYRSEKAVEELHASIRRQALVERDDEQRQIDVVELVPGDIVALRVGDIVPADLRLIEAVGARVRRVGADRRVRAREKADNACERGGSPLDLPSCAFMGTVVRDGSGRGVIVATGARTAFGGIALRLGERQGQTAFQRGLQDFSRLLVSVTGLLAGSIFVHQHRARAVVARIGSLRPRDRRRADTAAAAGDRHRQPRDRCQAPRPDTRSSSSGSSAIEDLGNIKVLFTDKTGTLTEGHIRLRLGPRPIRAPRQPGARAWAWSPPTRWWKTGA